MDENSYKILVAGPSWIGDMVIAQSLFKLLKIRNPQATIDVIAPEWTEPLLARMPEVDNAIPIPLVHGKLSFGLRWRIGRDLQKRQYDRAIVLSHSFKSAIVPFIARARRRTGFLGELRWGLLNDIRRLNRNLLPRTVDRFISLGLEPNEIIPSTIPMPSLEVKTQSISSTLVRLGKQAPKTSILGLCPGAEYGPAKRWPVECFAAVANEKLDQGWHVWLFGSEKDASITGEIQSLTQGRCLDLAGRTSLTEAIDLMSLTISVVSNDSGMMHIAAALGRHTIAIYGSSNPRQTPPLCDNADILYLGLSCSPCFKPKCPPGHLNCLNDLQPRLVLKAISKNKCFKKTIKKHLSETS